MSIQDDYWDIQHILRKQSKETKKTFEHFARWAFDLEQGRDEAIKQLNEANITIKTMMKLKT